ncbi:MAG: 3' terminal RNA ribose 2'-O-methyltransferase Hen1, partial [Myxococcota bacterium]
MFLTLSTTHAPATDLGYLLEKHPDRIHRRSLPFGEVLAFFPQATEHRCTIACFLDIDPIGLVRRSNDANSFALEQYVNDRPYCACSFFSVALIRMFGSALKGKSRERPELTQQNLPWEVHIPTLPSRGGAALASRLFAPLGYIVEATQEILDPHMPGWGSAPYLSLTLKAHCTLQTLLQHLYVLIPVFDDRKHYWVGLDEVEKLLEKGTGWLEQHPEKHQITRRYLKHFASLTKIALRR